MAVAEKLPDVALGRLTKQITLAPKSGGLQWLLGPVYFDRRELDRAEAAFLRAIELQPSLIDAYVNLLRSMDIASLRSGVDQAE